MGTGNNGTAWEIRIRGRRMTPIIDNWVLIVDGNNYTIARYFGEKTDKNGKTYKDIRDAKYYTSLSGAFRGLRGQLERETLSKGFQSLVDAFRAVIESNARVTDAFNRIADQLEGRT